MKQLHLFPTITNWTKLQADSPKKAFYIIMIVECQGAYTVVKESGCDGRVMDTRRWVQPSFEKAWKKFNQIIRNKTNPSRGSPRKYKKVLAQKRARTNRKMEVSHAKAAML